MPVSNRAPLAASPFVHLVPHTHDAGAENQALYLLDALREHLNRQLELAYFRAGRNHDRFAALDIPIRHVPPRGRLALDLYPRSRRLRALYRGEPPALLHTWLFEASAVGLLAARAWPETRVVVGHRAREILEDKPAALRFLFRRTDYALANSDEGAEAMVRAGVNPARVSIVPQGIPEERVAVHRSRADVRAKLGIGSDVPVVGFVGRADPAKDVPTLFAAMEDVWAARPDALLLLVGPTAAELQRLGQSVPRKAITVGWQAHPADFMNACDAMVISSRTEGHANVAGEALLLGIPLATTDAGGHPEVVSECGGRVVPVGSPGQLGDAVLDLLNRPPDRSVVAAAARDRLGFARVLATTLEVYERVLSAPPARVVSRFAGWRRRVG